MKALILVGGLGTRLRSQVSDLPKSMAPIAGKPFLEWQLMMLKAQGFHNIVLCTGYLADPIVEYFGDGSKFGLNIDYSFEEEPRGTAGAIRNASGFIDGTFLLVNGDTFFDMDCNSLLDFHEVKGAMVSLALTMVEDVSRYGSVTIDINGRVKSFKEKSPNIQTFGYINAGVYVVERAVMDHIAEDTAVSLEKDVIPKIINRGLVYGYVSEGYFVDIGTPESYEQARKYFAR